jgi:hypothetical protein
VEPLASPRPYSQRRQAHRYNSRTLCEVCEAQQRLGTAHVVLQVTVLEKMEEAGKKVLISGGTRWYVQQRYRLGLAVSVDCMSWWDASSGVF